MMKRWRCGKKYGGAKFEIWWRSEIFVVEQAGNFRT